MEFSLTQHTSEKVDRILLVDDSADNLFLVQSILEEEGYQIFLAEAGQIALDFIRQSPPDLILLDVMMPVMDGFEVTRKIRNSQLPFIPILLITAYDQPSVVKGLDNGADDFIRKPVEVDELLARVRCLLRLKHSVDERDAIARQREDFVSRLTHDLRTPLVAADRMLQLFQEGALGDLPPTMLEAIQTMLRSNRNLLDMVNTLLEVYRYEAGSKTLSFTEVNLPELLQNVISELIPLTKEKNLEIEQSYPEEKVIVKAERLELHRVFTNLIANAIKFTDEGSVSIRLQISQENDYSLATVEIEDTGTGISQEDQQHLFLRFRQGRHNRSGSGLGLHLSRRIVEAHEGTIKVESELGKGTKFIVCLPTNSKLLNYQPL